MNDYIKEITLDLNCAKTPVTINSAQFDKGRKLSVDITADGDKFDISNCTAVFKGVRSDKTHFAIDCEVKADKVMVTFKDTDLSVKGLTIGKIVISDGIRTYSTQMCIIDVDSSLDGDITASDEYSILNRLIEQIHALNESGGILVDDELNEDSNNPIQNSTVAKALTQKVSSSISSTQLIKLVDTDTTINGLHITVNNNHITISGTATTGIYQDIAIDEGILKFEANTNYAISFQNIKGDKFTNPYDGLFVWISSDGNKAFPIPDSDASAVINTTTEKEIHLRWNLSAGEYNKEFDFKIEYGTETTPFEPYYVVDSVANNSITKEKLSEDVQSSLNAVSDLPTAELFGKSMYSDGDSIADGSVTNKISYAHLIAEKYSMNLTSKAVGNTTIAVRDGQVSSIVGRVLNMTDEYDYILLNGGTNDVTYNVPLGEIAEGTNVTFTEETRKTTLGALEEICQFLNTNYCKAKKLFIFTNARVDGTFAKTKETNSKMKKVLNKYGISYIDISEITSLGIWNDEIKSEYFVDSIHPNAKAYEDFYVPCIEKALLYGSYGGSGGSTIPASTSTFKTLKCGVLGDSITYGAGASSTEKGYAYLLKNDFSSVEVNGVPGANVSNGYLSRINNLSDDLDVIIVLGGINDYATNIPLGTISSADTTFYGALNNIVNALKSKYLGKELFLCTPLQASISGKSSDIQNSQNLSLQDYRKAIIEVAEKYSVPCIDLYAMSGMNFAHNVDERNYYSTDGVHPNDIGHQKLYERVLKSIQNILVSVSTVVSKELISIDAVYTQNATVVYPTTSLNSLKSNLVVEATYNDGSTSVINSNDYTLTGTLEAGTSSITVNHNGKTDTFNVVVTEDPEIPIQVTLTSLSHSGTLVKTEYVEGENFDATGLTFTAIYSDGSSKIVMPIFNPSILSSSDTQVIASYTEEDVIVTDTITEINVIELSGKWVYASKSGMTHDEFLTKEVITADTGKISHPYDLVIVDNTDFSGKLVTKICIATLQNMPANMTLYDCPDITNVEGRTIIGTVEIPAGDNGILKDYVISNPVRIADGHYLGIGFDSGCGSACFFNPKGDNQYEIKAKSSADATQYTGSIKIDFPDFYVC